MLIIRLFANYYWLYRTLELKV